MDTVFLQTLVEGNKSLYLYNRQGHLNFYIKQAGKHTLLKQKRYVSTDQGNTQLVVVERTNFIPQLRAYLPACPTRKGEVPEYTISSLKKFFKQYYACRPKIAYTFFRAEEKILAKVGFLAGGMASQLRFFSDKAAYSHLTQVNYPISFNATGGVFLEFIFPRTQRKWSIYNEALLTNYATEATYETSEGMVFTSFKNRYFKLYNGVRFAYPIKTFSITATVGMVNALAVFDKNEVLFLASNGTLIRTRALSYIKKYKQGIALSLGSQFKKKVGFEIRYERNGGLSPFFDLGSPIYQYYCLISYYL